VQSALNEGLAREVLGGASAGVGAPSHVLFEGRALSLSGTSLVVGRAPGSAQALSLPDGLAGVSRRHCTFVRDGNELVLIDHSNYGTFVNGERVSERVRIHVGDKVRLGEPGVELSLIAIGEVA
jgi:pSer/pThr/pTyr-binding forkhead associated (FHA) protein